MTGSDFSLRRAAPGDLAAIMPLVADLHAGEGIALAPGAARSAMAELLSRPDLGAVWVIEAAGRIVGYAAVAYGFSIVFGGRDGFLDEYCLAADWRGRGVGRAALTQIAAELAAAGVRALHLEVHRDKPRAASFYRDLGFDLRDGYHLMSKPLS